MNDTAAAPTDPQPEQPERPDTSSGWVPQAERRLLRALIDIPDFAARVVPAIDPELFEYPASQALYTFVAEDFQQHHAAPDFHTLHVRNDSAPGHNERTVKVVAALLRNLEQMAPIPANQLPILLKDAEEWIRERKAYTLLSRVIVTLNEGTDPRPLIEQFKANYEWRLDESTNGRYAFKNHDTLLHSVCAPFLVRNLLVQNSLVALVSPPGCNKTFLALDLALSVASGQSTWLGEPLHLSGPVVYVLGDHFVIYDGRVGAALGLLVRTFCEQSGRETIPPTLAFAYGTPKEDARAERPKLRNPSTGPYRFPRLSANSHAHCVQAMRASWLLRETLNANGHPFSKGEDGFHELGAALFMVGYDLSESQR